ncbi:uncharacterized protein [Argopecten irradians]|uniref:uncharacterized protein n=1 Tax=Argopecten irradians TaxID=31199 RepID=UPI00371715EB
MYCLLTLIFSVFLLDLPFALTQTPPPSSTSTTANACPVLNTNRQGRNLHVDLVSNLCQFVVSVTPQTVFVGRSVRQVHFLSGSYRRAGTLPGLPVRNCSPYNIRIQHNTIVIETRPRQCFVTVALKEVLTPELDANNGLRFTNIQSYEVKKAGPFPATPTLPIAPRPGLPSGLPGQSAVRRQGIPSVGNAIIQRPGMQSVGIPAVQRPGSSFSGQSTVQRPGTPSSQTTVTQQSAVPSFNVPGFSPFGPALGQSLPQIIGFTPSRNPGVQSFMPLNLGGNAAQTGSQTTQNTGSTSTKTGDAFSSTVPGPLTK